MKRANSRSPVNTESIALEKPRLRFFHWIVLGVACIYLIFAAAPARDKDEEMHLVQASSMPVLDHGRVKPLDTLARTSLMIISGKQTAKDKDGNSISAANWLLDVMTSSISHKQHDSMDRKSFRIDDEQIRKLLGLQPQAGNLYSFNEIDPNAKDLFKEAMRARDMKEKDRTPFDKAVLDLGSTIALYHELAPFETSHEVFRIENLEVLSLLGLDPRPGFRYSFSEILPRVGLLVRAAAQAKEKDEKEQTIFEAKALELGTHVQLYVGLARWDADTLKLVPPVSSNDDWQTLPDAINAAQKGAEHPAFLALAKVLQDYAAGKKSAFNEDLDAYAKMVDTKSTDDVSKSSFEVFFNQFAPFYHCMLLYVLVCLLSCIGFMLNCFSRSGYSQEFNRAAFWLSALTLAVHTFAIISRMVIQGRPPVTNLYSSAVFIGWGCVVLGLVLESMFRNGIGNIVSGVLGSLTLLIAHYLATSGDTLEMMQAVLDTNFWLATHVVCVTAGYTATFVAGLLGTIYVLWRLFNRLGSGETGFNDYTRKTLSQMIYGVVCFATLLSFTGTVLGGIWADQSWGRFWGWDPKENGALIIVIWNALILHARWGGMVKARGMAVLTIVGNIVTAWSWFGVNMLGVGLHSYGFMAAAVYWLAFYVFSQVALIVVGLLPLDNWTTGSVKNESRPVQPPTDGEPREPAEPVDTSIQPAGV